MVRLRDLGQWSGGNTPSKAREDYWTNGTLPWVSPKDMKTPEITSSEDRISEIAMNEGRASLLPPGAVLVVTRSGILSHTLPVATTRIPVTINQDIKALVPRTDVLPNYVAYALKGAGQRILNSCSKHGTTVASIETNALLDFEIPLVDLDEQHRIVAEIDKQFSRLDEAVANLQRVKANLKRYKAAVLKAAVEGSLVETEASIARRDGRGYETGEQLLQVALIERRKKWDRRGPYVEPTAANSDDLSPVPEGWTWATVEQLGFVRGGKRLPSGHKYADEITAYPYLRVTDFADYGVNFDGLLYLKPDTHREIKKYTISSEDLYISIAGSIGLVGVVPEHLSGANLTENAAKITGLEYVSKEYLMYWLSSAGGIEFISDSTIATTQAKLALYRIERIPVPLPPLAEQVRIVAEVERHLSIIREVEAGVDANLQRVNALRQATLVKVFTT